MADITLNRSQAKLLVGFCDKNKLAQFFVAKDQGAYVGASIGSKPEEQCLFYFAGCDPKKDEDWYDNARRKFGGDDFGDHLNIADIKKMLDHPQVDSIRIRVTKTRIAIDGMTAPAPKKAAGARG